jgi:hypothetical protein
MSRPSALIQRSPRSFLRGMVPGCCDTTLARLIELREAFKKSGLTEQEKTATFAIRLGACTRFEEKHVVETSGCGVRTSAVPTFGAKWRAGSMNYSYVLQSERDGKSYMGTRATCEPVCNNTTKASCVPPPTDALCA